MVSVRRVAPILLLAVTLPVWAQAPTTTAKTTQKKTTTTTAAPAPAPAPTSTAAATTSTSPTTTTPAVQKTTKKTKRAKKPAKATTAEKPAEKKPAEKKPAAKTASKATTKSTHPPRELHKVGDHWTAYNPPDPSTYPAGAKTYTIKAGDTLWALAKQYYNNAYLWPQLWEANTWITDAHWIYPGDVLLVEGEIAQQATSETGAATTGAGTAATTQPTQAGTGNPLAGPQYHYITPADAVGGSAGPVALATEADLYCYGYIGDPNEPLPNEIAGWEDVEVRYQPGATKQEIDGSQGDL